MDQINYRVIVNHQNSLCAVWADQAVFHQLDTDNLYLVTAQTANLLNSFPDQTLSLAEFRNAVRIEAGDKSLADDTCDAYIKSLLEQRLIKKSVE